MNTSEVLAAFSGGRQRKGNIKTSNKNVGWLKPQASVTTQTVETAEDPLLVNKNLVTTVETRDGDGESMNMRSVTRDKIHSTDNRVDCTGGYRSSSRLECDRVEVIL